MSVAFGCFAAVVAARAETLTIGAESVLPTDPRQSYARFVRFRPGDGQVVQLNPPRFSWPYVPEIVPARRTVAERRFTLQIGSRPDLSAPEVEIRDTPYNFYNFLPPLTGASVWYWRVGWDVGSGKEQWSEIRSFVIADDAVVWDRSQIPVLLDQPRGHPRLLFDAARRDEILALYESDPRSRLLGDAIIARADEILTEEDYRDFPATDEENRSYRDVGKDLLQVAFAWLLTGDERYRGFKERFLTLASWGPGGFSTPEGSCPKCHKWGLHVQEYLGLFYDWFYDELTASERAVVLESMRWRLDLSVNNFSWRLGALDGDELRVHTGSVAVSCNSHPYEGLLVSLSGALAVYDELPLAREVVELGLHYLIGISNGFGEDEGWNEGPAYGSSKMKWLMDASIYLHTMAPELQLQLNPAYASYRDFFTHVTPLVAPHSAFGNNSHFERHRVRSRMNVLRKVALLTQDGRAMACWQGAHRRWLSIVGEPFLADESPWIDFVLPYYFPAPEPQAETDLTRLYALEGWVAATTAELSDPEALEEAVSVTFQARPRGGYSHGFRSDNAFEIHAYGETITVGGGNTMNRNPFPNQTMAHNTILVDGRGQEASLERWDDRVPVRARIVAFEEGDGYVYWAGDATAAYAPRHGLERFIRHMLFVDGQYVVIYDDLQIAADADPARFDWLYHTTPDVPVEIEADAGIARYSIGATKVHLQQLHDVDRLVWSNRVNGEGMVNPVTGEDFSEHEIPPSNHLWLHYREPSRHAKFVAAIVPYLADDAEPIVRALDDGAIEVTFRGVTRRISFDPAVAADLAVDVAAIAAAAPAFEPVPRSLAVDRRAWLAVPVAALLALATLVAWRRRRAGSPA